MPAFNNKRAALQWKKMVEDLLAASSSNSKSISPASLKASLEKLEEALGITSKNTNVSKSLEDAIRSLAKKIPKLEGASGKDDTFRKEMREELKSLESRLRKSMVQGQSTLGRALQRDAQLRQREAQRQFAANTRKNEAQLKRTLAKQLLEVQETRSLSDDEGLQRLEADLAKALKALQIEDFKKYKEISDSLKNLEKNYGAKELDERFSDIEDLVEREADRRNARNEKLDRFAEKATGALGLGGLYRGVKRTARLASSSYRLARSAKNTVARGLSRTGSAGSRAYSSTKRGVGAVVAKLLSKKKKDAAEEDQQNTRDQTESSLLRRQINALEAIAKATAKKGRSVGGGLMDGLRGLLSGAGGMLGNLGKLGLKYLAPLLGKLGAVGVAAFAGWKLGSFIYEKFATEIQDGLEAVVGVVTKGIDFATRGYEWFKGFLSSPLDKVKEIGGALKDAWDKSIFAKFFSSPGKIMSEGVTSLMSIVSGAASSAGDKVADLTGKAMSAASTVGANIYKGGSAALDTAGTAISSAVSGASDYVSSGYRSIRDAVGKLFRVNPKADLENLNPAVQANFMNMAAEYKAMGGTTPLSVNSAFRSNEEQARLYAANPSKAAPPGRSSHGRGLAIDIDSAGANKLDSMGLLDKYGFSRPVRGEAWHLQAKGTASVLASGGVYSADSPINQGISARRSTGSPVVDAIPTQTGSASSTSVAQSSPTLRVTPQLAGKITQGSASNIPTFSYLDDGFFIMNAGVIAG